MLVLKTMGGWVVRVVRKDLFNRILIIEEMDEFLLKSFLVVGVALGVGAKAHGDT